MNFKSLPRAARVFIVGLFIVSLILLFFISLRFYPFRFEGNILIFIFLLVFISLSDLYRVEFTLINSNRASITLSLPATFASIFLFNPLIATLVSSIGGIIGDMLRKVEWFKTMFNFSQYVITVGISSLAYNFIISFWGKENSLLTGFSAVTVAGLVYFLLNSFLAVSYTHLTLPTNREV